MTRSQSTADISSQYPNIKVPTAVSSSTNITLPNPQQNDQDDKEVVALKKQNIQLKLQLQQRRVKEAELRKKIKELEDRIRLYDEDNLLLQKYNEVFGDNNEKLTKENKKLKYELDQYTFRPRKRIAISEHRSESPAEKRAAEARVRI
jgi:hypothetical protein